MSLYGHAILQESAQDDLSDINLQEFVQTIAYDDISRGTSEQIKEFCESTAAQVLQEKQVLNKKTMMRLSKADDEKRRIKLICYQLARDAKDPNWTKMCKYRGLMKEYRAKIMAKYGAKATRIARAAQKEYIKTAKKLPNSTTTPQV